MGKSNERFIIRREYVNISSSFRASVMSGKNGGVQALLRQRYIPHAIYVHCYAHKLNLVICDVTKDVPYLSEFYSIVSKIYTYFHASSVTSEIFKLVQQQLNLGNNISSLFITNEKSLFSFRRKFLQ
jgi:hypothetical protein